MLNYKLTAALLGNAQELCVNDTIIKRPTVFEREGSIDNGFVASLLEAVDDKVDALDIAANNINGISFDAKASFEHRKNAVCDAIVSANETVFEKNSGGCTIVSAVIKGGRLAVTNLGRSAAFLLQSGELKRLTDEHCALSSVTDETVRLNTRYIGLEDKTSLNLPVYNDEKLNPGDVLILCSSEVCDVISEEDLLSILQLPKSLSERINIIIDEVSIANPQKQFLNLSIVLMEVGRENYPAIGSFRGKRLPELHESPWYALAIAAIFITAAVIIMVMNANRHSSQPGYIENPTITPEFNNGDNWNPIATPIPNITGVPDGNAGHKVDSSATPIPNSNGGDKTLGVNNGGNNGSNGSNGNNGSGGTNNGNGDQTSIARPTARPTTPPDDNKPIVGPTQPPMFTPPPTTPTPAPTDKPTPEPETEPPVTDAPVTEPPITDAPVTEPPITDAPVTEPPVTDVPETEPPVTDEPVTEPPATDVPESPEE